MKSKKTSTLHGFFVSFGAVLAITIITVFAMTILLSTAPSADVLGGYGSLLQGTLGVAVGLAGAYVAIKIASLSYTLVNQQKSREDFLLVSDKISNSIMPLIKLSRSLRDLYWTSIIAQTAYQDEMNKLNLKVKGGNVPDGFWQTPISGEHRLALSNSVLKLSEAIDDITDNSDALFIWMQCPESKNLRLPDLKLNGESRLSVQNDLSEVASVLKLSAYQLKKSSEHMVLTDITGPKANAYSAKSKNGEEFNSEVVRGLLRTGLEIKCLMQNDSVSNLGAAIIFDLLTSIPKDSKDIIKIIEDAYGDVVNDEILLKMPVIQILKEHGFKYWLGASLNEAYVEFKKIEPQLITSFR